MGKEDRGVSNRCLVLSFTKQLQPGGELGRWADLLGKRMRAAEATA